MRSTLIVISFIAHHAHGMVLARARGLLRVSQLLQDSWDTIRQSEPRHNEMSQRVRAAPSSTHGTGLFARQDLASGTVTTFYPVHALGMGANRLEFEDGRISKDHDEMRSCVVDIWHKSLRKWAPDMWIDADPSRCVDGWLGHLANDAASCAAGADEAQILDYYSECARSTNAVMVPYGHGCAPLMCVVTTRDVREGDELLISYGHNYWITRGCGAPSAAEGDEVSKKASTPAIVAASDAATEPAIAAQSAVEAEYAPEISRFEQIFAAAAREAASESMDARDIIDERREAQASAASSTPGPVNRRQRRVAAKKKKKKKGSSGGGFA